MLEGDIFTHTTTNRRRIYVLASYTVEKRQKGWYVRRTDYDDEPWMGPYSTETSVCLTIARRLKNELVRRDERALAL